MIVRLPACWRDLITVEFQENAHGNLYHQTANASTWLDEGPAPTSHDPRPFYNDLREVTVMDGQRMVATFRLASDKNRYRGEVVVISEKPEIYLSDPLDAFNEIEHHHGEEFIIVWVDELENIEIIQTQ